MNDEVRGKITNPDRKRQLIDMTGVRYGKVTPTDIEGFIEMDNLLFVLFELKHADTPFGGGQKLAFLNLVDAIRPPKHAVLIHAKHYTPVEDEIYAAHCEVVQYRECRKWFPGNGFTLKGLIDEVVRRHRPERLVE